MRIDVNKNQLIFNICIKESLKVNDSFVIMVIEGIPGRFCARKSRFGVLMKLNENDILIL